MPSRDCPFGAVIPPEISDLSVSALDGLPLSSAASSEPRSEKDFPAEALFFLFWRERRSGRFVREFGRSAEASAASGPGPSSKPPSPPMAGATSAAHADFAALSRRSFS